MDTTNQSDVTSATIACHRRTQNVIYLVTCKINGKLYVGQTSNTLWGRWRSHRNAALSAPDQTYKQKTALARAMRLHGPANFDLTVLQLCASADELDAAEEAWIAKLGSLVPAGYNLAAGGKCAPRVPEVGERISAANRGRAKTPEWRAALRAAHLGKKLSAETRQKISDVQRGRTQSAETNAKRRASMLGKNTGPRSAETRARISAALMGRSPSPEARAKQAVAMRGQKRSEETKRRMSEAAFAREARKRAATV